MPRVIDVDAQPPTEVTVAVGDVIRFAASGGHVRHGTAVELLGVYVDSVLGTHGGVLTPAGPPNVVMFRARAAGESAVDVVTGDPFRAPVTHPLRVVVTD